jgi:hypothetical protein
MSEENPIARMQRRLRADTAKLLNYDINNLSAWQSVRLDRAVALRLQLDDISAAQLRCDPIDMPHFILASKELEAMLGGNPEQTTSPNYGAIAEIEAMIDGLLRTREQADHKRDADLMWREEQAAILAAGGNVDLVAAAPAVAKRSSADDVSHPALPAAPAAPPPRRSMDEINAEGPPQHYLQKPREAWREHIDADGNIVSPWFRPHG